jgi:Domain amino terminal to FKBP-type peptidyl-prolyl isomerase
MTVTMVAKVIVAVWLWVLPIAIAGSNEEGLKFLDENKQKPGVITLGSGLQYKVSFLAEATSPRLRSDLTLAVGLDGGIGKFPSIDQYAVFMPL